MLTVPCSAGDEEARATSSAEVRKLIKDKNRVQTAFKQSEDDEDGSWWGGIIWGTRQIKNEQEFIVIGYDDGELQFHSFDELQDLYEKGKFKGLTSETLGLVGSEQLAVLAIGFSTVKINGKVWPVGVLLGETKHILCKVPPTKHRMPLSSYLHTRPQPCVCAR